MMFQAWNRGISTYEFRKCLKSDIDFIKDFDNMLKVKQKQIEHENRIKQAMESLKFR